MKLKFFRINFAKIFKIVKIEGYETRPTIIGVLRKSWEVKTIKNRDYTSKWYWKIYLNFWLFDVFFEFLTPSWRELTSKNK